MALPTQLLLSDILRKNVRCDKGIDHGSGTMAWMHPPVHRLLGWVTKPSQFRLSRDVWRLNQIKAITDQQIYVKGQHSISDQLTLDRIPTLIQADLISRNDIKIGFLADIFFELKSGKILYYLVSRTNPKLPGTSRWRLDIDRIFDQQPGMVSVNFDSLDDIPLVKSSLRQNFLKKGQNLQDQINDFRNVATNSIEGWLEEIPWDEADSNRSHRIRTAYEQDPLENWEDYSENDLLQSNQYNESTYTQRRSDEDPWI